MRREPQFRNLRTIWEPYTDAVAARSAAPDFPFGITLLDDLTHGIPRGKYTLIASRLSEGKTAFALQTALQLAQARRTVAYITLEDDSEQCVERLFANYADVDNQALRCGTVAMTQLRDPAILAAFDQLPLLVLDDFGYTMDEIRRVVLELEPRPEIVFLDYVQMADPTRGLSPYESLTELSRQLKKFAEQEAIAMVVLCQINRQGAREGRPQLFHLEGSDRLGQNADLALLLYTPYNYDDHSFDFAEGHDEHHNRVTILGMKTCPPEYVEIIVAKQKNGRRGVVPVYFDGSRYRFTDWTNEKNPHYETRSAL